LPLTNKYSSVTSKIDSLAAKDETYIPSGLAWGWRTLSPEMPFTEAKTSSKDTVNVMVLMTDGANTKSLDLAPSFDGTVSAVMHNNTDGDDANTVSETLCKKIKAENIQIYTVAYKFDGAKSKKTKDMLEDCATSADHFFDAKNSDDLNQAFDDIARSLFKIRLSL
jgi:Mg-chelatase subunit ChlD